MARNIGISNRLSTIRQGIANANTVIAYDYKHLTPGPLRDCYGGLLFNKRSKDLIGSMDVIVSRIPCKFAGER
jgi:hypothetical protein